MNTAPPTNPNEYAYLKEYSPYHRVEDGVPYPAVLLISGDSDTRCHPMHARKMTARLQQATSSGKPILLDYREIRGHAGVLPLADRIDTLANQFCFLLKAMNLGLDDNNRMIPAKEDQPKQ